MEKVLITGGMGFIGNHLAYHLLSKGKEVFILDKSIHKPTFCDIHKATIIEGDILSHELVHECLQQVDTCFHLAALSSVAICSKDWIFSHENNVLGFNGVLEEIRRLNHPIKLIYASSAAVYGHSKILPSTESEHVVPRSTYGADKISNEIYATVMQELAQVHSVGLRLFNVYGPGQLRSNPYSGVITSFKLAIKNNQPLTIYGDGKQTRDFIYIDDVIAAFMAAAATAADHSGIYNVCTGSSISIEKLAQLMISLSRQKLTINYLPERPDDLKHSLGEASLAKKELGFVAKIPMDLGLDLFLKENTFSY